MDGGSQVRSLITLMCPCSLNPRSVIGDRGTNGINMSMDISESPSYGSSTTRLNLTHQYISLLLLVFLNAGLLDVSLTHNELYNWILMVQIGLDWHFRRGRPVIKSTSKSDAAIGRTAADCQSCPSVLNGRTYSGWFSQPICVFRL